MDFINNSNIDNAILICNLKSESDTKYLDLLFENEKRSGGGEIELSYYDNNMHQFLIVFKNANTVQNVINFGEIKYKDEVFKPYSIDKCKFIIRDASPKGPFKDDMVKMYAENLLKDINADLKVDYLNNLLNIIICDQEIDFDRMKSKYESYNQLKQTYKLHLVAKLSETDDFNDFYARNVINGHKSTNGETQTENNDRNRSTTNLARNSNIRTLSEIRNENSDNQAASNGENEYDNSNRIRGEKRKPIDPIEVLRLTERIEALERQLSNNSRSNDRSLNNSDSDENVERRHSIVQNLINNNTASNNNGERATASLLPINSRSENNTVSDPIMDFRGCVLRRFSSIQPNGGNTTSNRIARDSVPAHRPLAPSSSEAYAHGSQALSRLYEHRRSIGNTENPSTYAREQLRQRFLQRQLQQPSLDLDTNSANNNRISTIDLITRQMSENGNALRPTGLDRTQIDRFPVIKFSSNSENDRGTCSICLETFINDEQIRILCCFDKFHVQCIDQWLIRNRKCPCCKYDLFNYLTNCQNHQ